MHDCLQFLVNRTKIFLEHVQEHQCHKMALQYVLDEAKKELLRPDVSTPGAKLKSAKPSTQKPKSSGPGSPVKRRNTRRRSSGPLDDEIEPEQQLLRNLGISLPTDAVSNQSRIEALERALLDRSNKLEGHANNLQSSTESSISSHLLDAQVTLHLLRDSLLAQSPYHSVKLLDPEVESSITELENDVQQVQQKLEKVDLQKLQAKNVHREQLVERWSR
jgi:DNA-binding HxlR family transcriptional regulator